MSRSTRGIFTSEKTDFFPRMESLFSGGGICSSEDPKNTSHVGSFFSHDHFVIS